MKYSFQAECAIYFLYKENDFRSWGASFPIQKKIHIRAFSWHWFIYELQKTLTNIQPEVDLGTEIAKPAFCENHRREVRIRSSLSVSYVGLAAWVPEGNDRQSQQAQRTSK